jgi:integrase
MAGKLSARKVETAKAGKYADGDGLYLLVTASGARRWTFRFLWHGKAREAGLGSVSEIPPADARERAGEYRKLVGKGIDPVQATRESKGVPTFGECADEFLKAKDSEWRNDKHRAQWKMTLEVYAKPLRSKPVDQIDTEAVLNVLKPVWATRPETASRLRGRIEHVLDAAKAKGYRAGENPALWRGHLDKLLPKRQLLSRGHHAAMPYEEVAGFVGKLRERQTDSAAAQALEFVILTAARSGEVRGATWAEIDLEENIWTVPARRMKTAREHRVPLSQRAVDLLKELKAGESAGYVFPGKKPDEGLSIMAMDMTLRRIGVEITVHGFRSSFRDWAGNETGFPRELAEAALSHVIGDKAEQAYRRSDALEKRRALMDAWAAYCDPERLTNVLTMAGARSLPAVCSDTRPAAFMARSTGLLLVSRST